MKSLRVVAVAVCLFFLFGTLVTRSRADEHNKLTTFTFDAPVEVPGFHAPLILPAGTYVFKLTSSDSNRNIVQIYNADQTRIYATVLAINNYRLTPTDKTVITFSERPSGSPQAIKAWFYPGDKFGQEFVYPRARAVELAKESNEPVPSMAEGTDENSSTLQSADVKVEQPSGEQEEVAEAMPARTLPKTASDTPLAALCGLLFLGAGIGLRLLTRKFV